MIHEKPADELIVATSDDFGPIERHGVRLAINANWLMTLRWAAVIGQLVTVGVVALGLGIELRLRPLLVIIGLTVATNAGLHIWMAHGLRRTLFRLGHGRGDLLLASIMMLDIVSLTMLLYFSGGPKNPFAIFFLVNLALAAVVLPPRWAWVVTAMTAVCFCVLLLDHTTLSVFDSPGGMRSARAGMLQQAGFVTAFVTCASVIVYFITRVTSELDQLESELRRAEQQRATGEKLEALATLAAGAAHELASPLSTIAVVAKELEHEVRSVEARGSIVEDVRLVRAEVDRCRAILVQMSADAGQSVGERWRHLTAEQLIENVLAAMKPCDRVEVHYETDAARQRLDVPVESLAQAFRGIVQNALDASPPEARVNVTLRCSATRLWITVRDQGPGMDQDVLRRAGEPFFTTKPPGQGMGLGLFLARRVVERLGGRIEVESPPGRGVTVVVELPLPEEPASSR